MKKFLLLIGLILAGAMSCEAKTLHFAAVADVHYTTAKKDVHKILNGFIERVNENKYDFVIFAGDNIDKSRDYNLKEFLKYTKKIKNTNYYLALGEKDAHKISGIAKPDYLSIVAKQNRKQKKAEASYYFYPNSDIIVIVVDGSSSGLESSHGVFTQKTLQWLDKILTKNKNKKAIIVQHFPYIEPFMDDSLKMLEKMDYKVVVNKHDNIIAIVSGHYHQKATVQDDRGITHISLPALYLAPYEYEEITVEYDKNLIGKPQNFTITNTVKPAI